MALNNLKLKMRPLYDEQMCESVCRTKYDTHQLLRVVEEQLRERDTGQLDIDRIWDMFRHADRSRSQVLSREQVQTSLK